MQRLQVLLLTGGLIVATVQAQDSAGHSNEKLPEASERLSGQTRHFWGLGLRDSQTEYLNPPQYPIFDIVDLSTQFPLAQRAEADWSQDIRKLKDKKILILGEGEDSFAAYLLQEGLDVHALDVDDSYLRQSAPYCKQFPGRYIHGDALNFWHQKSVKKGVDQIWSNLLYCPCCVGTTGLRQSLGDAAEILNIGGEMRHVWLAQPQGGGANEKGSYLEVLKDFLNRQKKKGRHFKIALRTYVRNDLPPDSPASKAESIALYLKRVK